MNDLSEYLDQKQRIKELEDLLEEYDNRHAKVLKSAISWKSKYHKLNAEFKNKTKPLTRSQKAIILLKSEEELTHKKIAKMCFMGKSHVSKLSSQINKGLHT